MKRFFLTLMVLLFLIGTTTLTQEAAYANSVTSPTINPGTLLKGSDPLLVLKKMPPPPPETLAHNTRVQALLKGLAAIMDGGIRLSTKRRLQIVSAAMYAQSKTGVDAMLLLAVARMESDFRNLVMINPACKYGRRSVNCFADCGMTQHHVRGSMEYVTRQCKKLARNLNYTFYNSAKELAHHVVWCKDPKHAAHHSNSRRCVLNRYNQGTFYKTKNKCKRWHNPWKSYRAAQRYPDESLKAFRIRYKKAYRSPEWKAHYRSVLRQQWKCRHRAAYWTKVSCFEYGARNGVKSIRSCRRCTSLVSIRTSFYKTPTTVSPITSFLFSTYLPTSSR